jgi:hypothetical protein
MTILGESDCANGLNITHHGVISHILYMTREVVAGKVAAH